MTAQRKTRKTPAGSSHAGGSVCFIGRHVAAILILALFLVSTGLLAAQVPSEYQIKAAFLMNFTKFIDWPATAFENSSSPLVICILGDDPFGKDIDQLVAGETINGRRLVVQRLHAAPPSKACQVLFVSKSEKDASAFLAGFGPGVLTVSDRDRFLQEGGMIALVVENQRVRFDVNQRAALRASLMMNARMLNVARSVQR